ncbi:MAG: hypothetical protein ABII18_04575 [bacterium]
MNKNQFVKITSRILVFFMLLLMSSPMLSCGGGDRFGDNGNSDTENSQNEDPPGDGDDEFDIPEGYAIYGAVDGETVQIPDGQTDTTIFGSDGNANNGLDSGESFSLANSSYNSATFTNDVQVSINVVVDDPLLFGINSLHDLASSGDAYINIQFPDTNFQSIQISEAIIYLTALGTTSGDTISGKLQVTLADERGSLSLSFSGQLDFVVFMPVPGE